MNKFIYLLIPVVTSLVIFAGELIYLIAKKRQTYVL